MQHGAWNSLQVLGPDRNWCFLWFLAGTYTCPEKELERMSQHIFWSSTWRFGFASTSFHPQTFSCLFCIIKKAMPKAHFPYCKRRKYVCKFRSQQHCSEHMRDKDGNEISRLGHAKNTTLISLYDSLSGDAWLRMGNHGPSWPNGTMYTRHAIARQGCAKSCGSCGNPTPGAHRLN